MKAEHDHDRSLDLALAQAFAAVAQHPSSAACLDAEALAAWMDDGLQAHERARAEGHVADCARCQSLVAALARVTPMPGAMAEPRIASRRWWLAPLAAGLAAATLWMVVPSERFTAPPASPPRELARAEPDTASPARSPAEPSVAHPAAPAPSAPSARSRDNAAATKSAGEARAAEKSTRAESRPLADEREPERRQTAEAQAQMAPSPPAMALGQASSSPLDVVSADPAVQWRIGADGALDLTRDGGRSWERLDGLTPRIVAGAAPSPAVCWLVGRGGLVFVTTDGRTFTRLPFPEPVDLVDVEATDALTALVTAIDGRIFVTVDGGARWRVRD